MNEDSNIHTFVNDLANKYTVYFDVHRNEVLDDIPLAFMAQYQRRDERYMFTKRIKIYGIENQQIVFTTIYENKLTEKFVQEFKERIEANFEQYISKHEEHMSTIVLGLIVTSGEIDQAVAKEVIRYRKLKFLKFGLHGWAELYVAIVHHQDKNILVHAKGKPFVESIEKLFNEESVTL